jgi:hypothetical protein
MSGRKLEPWEIYFKNNKPKNNSKKIKFKNNDSAVWRYLDSSFGKRFVLCAVFGATGWAIGCIAEMSFLSDLGMIAFLIGLSTTLINVAKQADK